MISLAEQRLRAAERQLQRRPKDPGAYAEMASAYMEKVRETGDGAPGSCGSCLPEVSISLRQLRCPATGVLYTADNTFARLAARRALERDPKDH
jgi:hypothetical protein